jgi:mono/diheme cytochrome c family protein
MFAKSVDNRSCQALSSSNNAKWFHWVKHNKGGVAMSRRLASTALVVALSWGLPITAHAAFDAAGFYGMRCATCHGPGGEGTKNHGVPPTGPALRANPFIMNGSVAAIRTVIRKGRSGTRRLYDDAYPNMPAFGPEAVPDVDALVDFLKTGLQK